MILTDTSVVVTVQRNPLPRLLQIIQDSDAAICGVTVAEIYAGARSTADFGRCAALLGVFRLVDVPPTLWPELGRNLFTLRTGGVTVPFPDALLAALSIELGVELWTYDSHFVLMQSLLPRLRLFQEPP